MKRKRMSIILVGCMMSVQASYGVYAGSFLDFGNALVNEVENAVSDLTDEVVNEVTDEMGEIWTEMTDEALEEIIGAAGEMWDSLSEDLGGALDESTVMQLYEDMLQWLEISGDSADVTIRDIFIALAVKVGMHEENAVELWDRIMQFAEDNGIDSVTISKLTIAKIVSEKMEDGFVKEQADEYVSDTIWGWVRNAITNQLEAEEALETQQTILEEDAAKHRE